MTGNARRIIRLGSLLATIVVGSSVAGAAAAYAAAQVELTDGEILAVIEQASKAPHVPDLLEGVVDNASPALDGQLKVSTPSAVVSVTLPGATDEVSELGDALFAYRNLPGVTTVPIMKTDGSVQVATVIEGVDSPAAYKYVIGTAGGSSLAELDKGYVAVLDEAGELIAGVAPAWAVDANGEAVDTWFEVNGDVLTQYVEHDANSAYPIVADPWVGGAWLESYSWLTSYRVQYTPTWWASWGCFGSLPCTAAWMGTAQTELVNAQTNGTYATRAGYSTTRNQIGCHMFGAGVKSPWNIETNVADIGLAGFIAHACNP